MRLEREARHAGHALGGQVVLGRAQPAAHHHQVGPAGGLAQRRLQHGPVVAHQGLAATMTPASQSRSISHGELVSTTWPVSSSSPVERSSTTRFMRGRPGKKCSSRRSQAQA